MEENFRQQHISGSKIIKIAFHGPESTGKTTLARQLAVHFNTVWAPEFARDYLQKKWDTTKETCVAADLLPIAKGQMQLENQALLQASRFLFVDTCLLTTKVYSEIYYGSCDPLLDEAAKEHQYDLFFLTDVDVPWEADDLRDAPNNRPSTFEKFKEALVNTNKPFYVLSGSAEIRLNKAIQLLSEIEKAKEIGFSVQDVLQFDANNVALNTIKNQLEIFKNGIAKTNLNRPATSGDGILNLSEAEFQQYSDFFDTKKQAYKLKKFVPASGAASRMFEFLIEFLNEFDLENETINAYINRKADANLPVFLVGMEKFPFFKTIDKKLKETFPEFDSWHKDQKNYHFIKMMLDESYLNFANQPKGILPFHSYKFHAATPIEEHLTEGALYCSTNGKTHLHFTISETHKSQFEKVVAATKTKIEKEFDTKIEVAFSHQQAATDTIAVDQNNQPFRDNQGKLVFRPGGHGALIENLNGLDAAIVFIKNIDNVIHNGAEKVAFYKKALAGLLIEVQEQAFQYITQFEQGNSDEIEKGVAFLVERLNHPLAVDFSQYSKEKKLNYLIHALNRPIRVCGMVKNEGEPGGGPFWVTDSKGNTTLQIVETTQIDFSNKQQVKIAQSATHFNPVDLVCGIRNYKGETFNMTEFIDPQSGFIVQKTNDGKPIKGYELPGLWNGAMAHWNTLFVAVPLITFNPVKTVNDLLKPAHQRQ